MWKKSIKNVYYLRFIFLIEIPILVMCTVIIMFLGIKVRTVSLANIQNVQMNLRENLENEVKQISLQLSHFVHAENGRFMELAAEIAKSEDDTFRYKKMQELEKGFQLVMLPKQEIIESIFYMENGESIALKNTLTLTEEEMKKSPWYQEALSHQNNVKIGSYDTGKKLITYAPGNENKFMIMAVLSPDVQLDRTQRTEAVAVFYQSSISNLLKKYKKDPLLENMVLLDSRGENIYYGEMKEELLEAAGTFQLSEETGIYKKKIRDPVAKKKYVNYTYVFSTVSSTGWKIVNFIPTSRLMGDSQKVMGGLFLAIMGIFFLFHMFSRYFLQNIISPLQNTVKAMEEVQKGNLDVKLEPAGEYEVRGMMISFNHMASMLKTNIEEKENALQKKHIAELQALQYQINLHFLVNTLNSIRFMAQISRHDGICKMTEALIPIVSRSFRHSIQFCSLREELELLKGYFYLMKIRYADGFIVSYDIDEQCMDCKIPCLILQSLAENAIVHGFTDGEFHHISLRAWREEKSLCLSMWDDGCGMTEEQIDEIMTGILDNEKNTSIGVQNIITRLRLNFGKAFCMSIKSNSGEYTKIVLRIPGNFAD